MRFERNYGMQRGNMNSRKGDIEYRNCYGLILYPLSSCMRPVISTTPIYLFIYLFIYLVVSGIKVNVKIKWLNLS